MKIYTRTGDTGSTALFGGGRVSKDHPRIRAYGTVDEANSVLGLARSHLQAQPGADLAEPILGRLQEELFVLGADLATPLDAGPTVPRIDPRHVLRLEEDIDRLEADLPPLKHFILPGGTPAAATLHVARTVCRRAERHVVEAMADEPLNEQGLIYLNRLSDLLFVLARWVNRRAGVSESTWAPTPR
ncbi:MAG: cob(I)yrinic acid a,c-diamide adenosyltransferase [Bacteroidetes bacterium]|nr:ATP:cob(I)alamin adenosyltransferase [Rhodothermaceae bacterium RA]RMH65524.1 MAG: cob(I)yrinic acid a,c-diamide adenosyltransferase [Bacteroidota bacterium]